MGDYIRKQERQTAHVIRYTLPGDATFPEFLAMVDAARAEAEKLGAETHVSNGGRRGFSVWFEIPADADYALLDAINAPEWQPLSAPRLTELVEQSCPAPRDPVTIALGVLERHELLFRPRPAVPAEGEGLRS